MVILGWRGRQRPGSQGLENHVQKSGLYPKCNTKSLKNFKQELSWSDLHFKKSLAMEKITETQMWGTKKHS